MVLSNRGQVTIFIILGILLLASAGFMFFIVNMVQTEELATESENVVSTLFERESLRIFTTDCLEDSLEEGLILLGEQGRIWEGQSGGSLTYRDRINGVLYGSENKQIYLGVTYDVDENNSNSYPCTVNTSSAPDFCQYSAYDFAEFGVKSSLTLSTVESDLQAFMLKEAQTCAEEFLNSELSYSGDLVVGDMELTVDIETEGFDISVLYPFELVVGDESYFHLEDFDFFYISDFQSFFTHAVSRPLIYEAQNITYPFNEEILNRQSVRYRELSPIFNEVEGSDGDTIISYDLDEGIILKNSPYSYFLSIENRPPALDYVSRRACSEYDYLVIRSHEAELGGIDIIPFALDPDDDSISYTSAIDSSLGYYVELADNGTIFMEAGVLEESFVSDIYEVKVSASDSHGLLDWQDVQILIDTEMTAEVIVENPYSYTDQSSKTMVSIEDPTFVRVALGGESVTTDATESASLSYTDGGLGLEEWSGLYWNFETERENCFSFPWPTSHFGCDIDSYSNDIENWKKKQAERNLPHSSFETVTSTGRLTLEFSRDYCSQYDDPEEDYVDLNVVACIPHTNMTNPFAYPYHGETYDENGPVYGEYLGENERVNPFLAGHSCCNPDTNAPYGAELEHVCYESVPGCYGGIIGFSTGSDSGYVLEESYDVCSGERGNICGDTSIDGADYRLFNNKMICGSSAYEECNLNSIPDICEGKDSWGFVVDETNGRNGWCHGKMGCSEVSYANSDNPIVFISQGSVPSDLSFLAAEFKANDDEGNTNFAVKLGCSNLPSFANEIFECDSNYDGVFEGQCQNGVCV